jgi:SsrA-binding protein
MKEETKNKRAYFDYDFLEKFEAGIILTGQEVKSIKLGRMNLSGSYVIIRNNEAYLINAQIPPYQPQNTPKNYEPTRARKLLLKKDEIRYLIGKSQERGLTLTPLRVYSKKRQTDRELKAYLKRG